ncbi:hypothetical protein T484DRAFT_1831855, partial [Baffinella frigidus]
VENRLALGHLVNHSGASLSPNVASINYFFPANVPADLEALVPNKMWDPAGIPKSKTVSVFEKRGLARRFVNETNRMADMYADRTIVTAREGQAAIPSQVQA